MADLPLPAAIDWIVAGGGSMPSDNQHSIEADLALAVERLGPGKGVLLYAGGPGTPTVQVLDDERRGDPLLRLLGDLFDPRPGRDAHYRTTTLAPHGAATDLALSDALAAALAEDRDDPLTLYLAGHGEPGRAPADTFLVLWGGHGFAPADLARALDAPNLRPARVVMTSCFSGAFADVAFAGADPDAGLAPASERCGLFATTWDRWSSGCDPAPDRRDHEGYGVHFLQALAGVDRAGARIPSAAIDLDHDGAISLLEAHTHARVASRGFEVPTTTSERWLARHAPATGSSAPAALPEEDAVIAALGAELGTPDTPADAVAARARVAGLSARIAELDAALERATEAEMDAVDRVAVAALSRWPVLDDPLHPDFAATIAAECAAIGAFFRADDRYHAYLAATERVAELAARRDAANLELARWLRLERAFDTLAAAGRLKARGGPAWTTFERLRTCESATP